MSGIVIKLSHDQIIHALNKNGIDPGRFDVNAALEHLFFNFSSAKRDVIAKFLRRASKRSLLSLQKLINLMYFSYLTRNLNGEIIEIGTFKGGSAYAVCALMAYLKITTKFVTIDTFSGFGNELLDGEEELIGKFSDGDLSYVIDLLEPFDFAVVKQSKIEDYESHIDAPIKLMHIDVDSYASTKTCLQIAEKWLVTGGIVVVDDVNSSKSPKVRLAVSEFFKRQNNTGYMLIPTNRDQSIILKI